MENTLEEMIAQVQHNDIWSHWMRYLFSKCLMNDDGDMIIPYNLVKRWKRQVDTGYVDLTEHEKDSDREQARKVMNCFGTWLMHRSR